MLQIVAQFDEEDAIVTIDEANLLLQGVCPGGRLIGPVTCPLALAPWVPQLEQFHLLSLMSELVD